MALLILLPQRADAHAAFVSSDPPPGAELASAPGVVVLRFTEPLVARLSEATVTDPQGQEFQGRVTAERQITVALSTGAPGVYQVEWKTVSPLDGHTLRGTFRFGVGVGPGDTRALTGSEPTREDLLLAGARALEYGALLLAVGMVVLARLARRHPRLVWARLRSAWALAVALASGLVVVLGEALLAANSFSLDGLAAYFTSGVPGIARLSRIALEALALTSALRYRGPAPYLGAAIVALAAAGHAAAVAPRWWGVTVDAMHLGAAGVWTGGIMALTMIRPPGGWKGSQARLLLDRFSPVALVAFVATIGSGVLRGTQELSGLADLFGTSYGRVLTLKILGVMIMISLSLFLWLRLGGTPRVDAVVAGVVIAMAALLAAYPLPPARLSEAAAAEQLQAGVTALPEDGDLTFGDAAGETLVGLTLRPAEPGINEVLIYVLPLDGDEAAAGIPVQVSVGTAVLAAEDCGLVCRRTEVRLEGGETLEVNVGGTGGGTAVFEIPSLPSSDGSGLYQQMQERMHALGSYRLGEILSSGGPVVQADYAFQAPDRIRIRVDSGFERVIIGDREWRRQSPDTAWRADEAIPLEVPRFIWDIGQEPVAMRIVGRSDLDGTPTTVLSFFARIANTPIWYRLWVDPESLVRRAEMRAQGHFMDHTYFAFDEPADIEPPVDG